MKKNLHRDFRAENIFQNFLKLLNIESSANSTNKNAQTFYLTPPKLGERELWSQFPDIYLIVFFFYINDSDNGLGVSDGFLLTKSGTNAFIYNRDNGHLEIGTNNKQQLHIQDEAAEGQLKIADGGIDITGHITASGDISASGTQHIFGGTVGIGIATPSETLHVVGNIKTTGNFYGTIGTSTQTNITSLGILDALEVQSGITAGMATFSNLPTEESGASTGGLYTQTGAQLGITGQDTTIFVLIRGE